MKNYTKLCVLPFGLALGVLWGLAMLITGLVAAGSDWGGQFISMMGSVYMGYAGTVAGAFIGALWGFIDGFIGGVVLAWLYNCFCRCSGKCSSKESCE